MKTKILIVLLPLLSSFLYAQETLHMQVKSGNYNREYLLYIPQSVQSEKPVGLVVCLHGFNRTMEDFFNKYPIAPVADSLHLIVLAPQALPEQDPEVIATSKVLSAMGIDIPLDAAWGCGLRVKAALLGVQLLNAELNKSVDDVTFINQIIHSTMDEYAIEPNNLFIFGTSMGGFMSYQYAMYHGDKLSGLVSVCGSMGTSIRNQNGAKSLPVCDFHSQDDEVVPYSGTYVDRGVTISLCQPKSDVIGFWTGKNQANPVPVSEMVHYYPSSNGKTATKYTYSHNENEVIHYQIKGASHSYYFSKDNGDCMDYNEEIYKFFKSHITKPNTGVHPVYADKLVVYPNPVKDWCVLDGTERPASGMQGMIELYSVAGSIVRTYKIEEKQTPINLSGLAKGMYILKYNNRTVKVLKN